MHTRRSNLRLSSGASFRELRNETSKAQNVFFEPPISVEEVQTRVRFVCAQSHAIARASHAQGIPRWSGAPRPSPSPTRFVSKSRARPPNRSKADPRPPLLVPKQEVHFLAEDEHLDIVPNFSLQGLHLLGGTVRPRALPFPRVASFARVTPRHLPTPTPNPRWSPDAHSTARSARRCAPACRCGSPCC